jgi:hypothetical protein
MSRVASIPPDRVILTVAFPRLQAVVEDYIVLEVLLSRKDEPCSQHRSDSYHQSPAFTLFKA